MQGILSSISLLNALFCFFRLGCSVCFSTSILIGPFIVSTECADSPGKGKYALQVFPEAGHFIHEDIPDRIALLLADFYRRNDRSALVLPPKISELLKQGKKV
jgi:protein phosphatase methylesterase 1